MRNLYIAVAAFFLLCVFLFVGSFVYLDKEKRKTYHYTVSLDGRPIGTIRIEKFDTEEMHLYKTVSNTPLSPLYTDSKSRLALDRKYVIETYEKDSVANGVSDTVSLERSQDSISFVSRYGPEFAYTDHIPIQKYTFVFDEHSPETYLPLIENFDFRRGKSQGFRALIFFSKEFPPVSRFVTLTSIRDEYIPIDSRSVKAEVLLLKIRNYPQMMLWIAKSDRSLLAAELPIEGIRFTRTFTPKTPDAIAPNIFSSAYASRPVSIRNRMANISGTLSAPAGSAKNPAILLVWGEGPQDRDYQGIFSHMADYFSKNGYCVLRLDKRGVAASGGEYGSATDSDIADDLNAAIEFLSKQNEVDPHRIALIAHSRGVFYALKMMGGKKLAQAVVFIAPLVCLSPERNELTDRLNMVSAKLALGPDYMKLASMSIQDSIDKAVSSTRNWLLAGGRRVFVKNLRERRASNPIEYVKNISVPVLVLQGREDDVVPIDYSQSLIDTLEGGRHNNHKLILFDYLGHFFSDKIWDGRERIHYLPDREALDAVRRWLDSALSGGLEEAPK